MWLWKTRLLRALMLSELEADGAARGRDAKMDSTSRRGRTGNNPDEERREKE